MKQPIRHVLKLLVSAGIVTLATQSTAFAYLDLGTGSFILQAALAGLAAAWLTCSTYWHRIKSLFQKKSIDADTDAKPTTASDETEPRKLS